MALWRATISVAWLMAGIASVAECHVAICGRRFRLDDSHRNVGSNIGSGEKATNQGVCVVL